MKKYKLQIYNKEFTDDNLLRLYDIYTELKQTLPNDDFKWFVLKDDHYIERYKYNLNEYK